MLKHENIEAKPPAFSCINPTHYQNIYSCIPLNQFHVQREVVGCILVRVCGAWHGVECFRWNIPHLESGSVLHIE